MTELSQIENLPLFRHLTSEEMDELAEMIQPVSFRRRAKIFVEDGPEDCLYVVTAGTVEVNKEILPGRQQHLATMDAPTVIGEMGLLTEPRSAATVTAKTAVRALAFPRAPFVQKLEAGNEAACKVAYQLGHTLARRMAQTDTAIGEIIAHMESVEATRDFDIFQDKLVQEWSF